MVVWSWAEAKLNSPAWFLFPLRPPIVLRPHVHMLRLSANNSSDSGEWEEAGISFPEIIFYSFKKMNIYCSSLIAKIKHVHKSGNIENIW